LVSFINKLDKKVIFLTMQPEDLQMLIKLKGMYQDAVEIDFDNPVCSYNLSIVIGMRYHACIWAGINNIPFIAVVYDQKVASLAKSLGQPCVELTDQLGINLKKAYEDIQLNYECYQKKLVQGMQILLERSCYHKQAFLGED
jgi:hypothetical protein